MTTGAQTLAKLARLVGGRVIGDGSAAVSRVSPIEEAGPGDITFLAHPRYRSHLKSCKATAVIVAEGVEVEPPVEPGRGYLVVADPYPAFARILECLHPPRRYSGEISPLASVDPKASVAENVTIFPFVYVGPGASIDRGTVLFPGVFVGEEARVGRDCVFYSNATVRERCSLGDRVVLHAGAVIGADGFGYADVGKERIKIPQVGTVEIGDDVEIGANTTVDRATMGRTVIGKGVKIDNLVQVAHNVVIGERTIIAAQTGIAGSTKIGRHVILAGQVGVADHVEIGDNAMVGPRSGLPRSVPPGAVLAGTLEAAPRRQWDKVIALLPRLPELWRELRDVKRRLSSSARRGRKGVKGHARR